MLKNCPYCTAPLEDHSICQHCGRGILFSGEEKKEKPIQPVMDINELINRQNNFGFAWLLHFVSVFLFGSLAVFLFRSLFFFLVLFSYIFITVISIYVLYTYWRLCSYMNKKIFFWSSFLIGWAAYIFEWVEYKRKLKGLKKSGQAEDKLLTAGSRNAIKYTLTSIVTVAILGALVVFILMVKANANAASLPSSTPITSYSDTSSQLQPWTNTPAPTQTEVKKNWINPIDNYSEFLSGDPFDLPVNTRTSFNGVAERYNVRSYYWEAYTLTSSYSLNSVANYYDGILKQHGFSLKNKSEITDNFQYAYVGSTSAVFIYVAHPASNKDITAVLVIYGELKQ